MADEQNWTVPVLAGLVVLGLAAAHGIDKTQWSQRFRPAPAAAGTPAPGSPTALASSAARSSTAARASTQAAVVKGAPATTAAVTVGTAPRTSRAAPSTTAPLGVQPGAAAGAVATTVSTVIVQTSVDTCWGMVVDGSALKGCGPAAVTDTRGTPAAAVTRTSGATALRVEIVRNGRSAATATVTATGRTQVLVAP